MVMQSRRQRAFTLVEILIVVVILGVLAAIVVPQFSTATEEASATATASQLRKLRDVLAVYQVRNGWALPNITEGSATWGELVTSGDYLRRPPVNRWVGPDSGRIIVFGAAPDAGYQAAYGWIYDPATGSIWAAGFDGEDNPYPKN